MTLRFVIPPKQLAMILKNVLEFTAGNTLKLTSIAIHAERDGRAGQVSAVGMGNSTACRDWAEFGGAEGDEVAAVTVRGVAAEKSDVIDDLTKLAAAIGKTSTAKSAQVFVTIKHRQSITVEYGGQLVGELADTGINLLPFSGVDEWLDRDDLGRFPAPVALMTENLKALTKIKTPTSSTVVDMAQLDEQGQVAVLALGPTFRGVMATVDRELYAAAGPWGDGPGTSDSLLGGAA